LYFPLLVLIAEVAVTSLKIHASTIHLSSYRECAGKGTKTKPIEENIKIPPGADTGTILRIPRKGHLGGDLLVSLSVGSHPYFRRDEYNIHTNRLISISQAVLGATIDVETLYGNKSVTVKPGTSSGTILTIPKCGIQKLYPNQYSRGDHLVHLIIKIPSYLNKKQKEAMKAYAEVEDPIITEDPKV
jgi:molecular chaperone DnaJ